MSPSQTTSGTDPEFEFRLDTRAVFSRLGWSSAGIALVRAKGIITLPLAIWLLGASGYGFVTVAMATGAAIAPLAVLNLPDGAALLVVGAVSQEVAEARLERIRRIGLAGGAITLALSFLVGLALSEPVIGWAGATGFAVVALKLGTVHLQYFQRTKDLVRIEVIAEYLAVILGLAVAVALGPEGMLAVNVLVLVAVAIWAAPRLERSRPGHSAWDPSFLRRALRLSLPLLPVTLAQWALFSVDSLLIYELLDAAAAGAYSAAYSLASVSLLLPLALNPVWYPTVQRVMAGSVLRAWTLARHVSLAVALVGGTIVLAALIAQPILADLFDGPFADTPVCVPWLAAGFAALALSKVYEGMIYARGRVWLILSANVCAVVANVVLNLIWIPQHGILGAAYATLVAYGVLAIVFWGIAHVVVTHRQ